ncbi:DNA-directed RNA polymerase III subunit RPC7-like isoform X1 [Euwallacea similis]|uniref:DNA-directed RNA polymerase III subunit RPC7-like isoform X1 n=1 Tax=Euwallacea similis TaxID=1736056 RepID=UPI00344B8C36
MNRGGGRGRGGGAMMRPFKGEQLTATGVANNEMLPTLVTQPPPLFPLLERYPVPLTPSLETDYLLILQQDFVDHMQLSSAYVRQPEAKSGQPEKEIDKLVAQIPSIKEKYDWSLFPVELRPKAVAKRAVVQKGHSEVNFQEKLKALEQLEEAKKGPDIKEEVLDNEEEIGEEVDEEMDEGTDYANNYFDNGDGYEEDDDNMDEGPIY